jgi:thiamine biosynthesis protein ThiI
MDTVTRVFATTNEISLKGSNRRWFENTLTNAVRRALSGLPVAAVTRPASRVLATFHEPVAIPDVARRLGTVFGLHSILPAYHGGSSLTELEVALAPHLEKMPVGSFAVRCRRSDPRFTTPSPEVERRVGAFIVSRTGWPVNLDRPDHTVHVLVDRNGMWFWMRPIPGPGGLPVGVGGRALCLLSGGIDSPVAAWMTMKRGVKVDYIHFHSGPLTDTGSVEKVEALVRHLNRFGGASRLVVVPLGDIQDEIARRCPPEYRILLYRRFMLRIAGRVARRLRARALVTGESLGQVASQTVENLSAVDPAVPLPVLRPLVALDKLEIIDRARRAGTYDLSIRPQFDCCAFLMPDRPATRASARRLAEAEAVLDVDLMVRRAVAARDVRRDLGTAPWADVPVPLEAVSP